MEPKKVGRTLGIGVRVASNMLRQRVEQAAQASASRPPAPPSPPLSTRVATAKRGAKAFGQAFLGPFTHAGKVLWLEMTGLFCALAAAFAWFSFSSFARAYRRSKRGPRGLSSK